MASDHRLKVGVDFGTTFSGVSWIHTAQPDEVHVVMKWPGTNGAFAKVPSEISYTPSGEVHKWGYQLKSSEQKIAWFKLLLQPARYASSSSLAATETAISVDERSPVDIIADYLCCLRKHFLETIKKALGKAFLEATPVDYTLTVPAIWGDDAKASTLEAAEKAGFGSTNTIQLMSEPDAAAAWSLLRDINYNELKVGDVFIVVDCGGGTVDLISYQVQKLKPLTAKECAKGTGGMCGSVFLNEGFKELVETRIGTSFNKMKTATGNRILKEWEEDLKREFTNSEDDEIFSCPISGVADDPKMGISGGDLIITREEMLGIFDPVINQILKLVQEQIDMVEDLGRSLHISAILLVGGFGESKYLSKRLESDLKQGKGTKPSSIEILQPVNAWSAVSRGAALGICISSRKSRRHYGVRCTRGFIHGKHPLRNLVYDRFTGEEQCTNSIDWHIKKGDEVSEDEPKSIDFSGSVSLSQDLTNVATIIYYCDEDEAPEYTNGVDRSSLGRPCVVYSDLSQISKDLFRKRIGIDQTPYYEILYMIVVTIKSGDVHYELEFMGKRYGRGKVKYLSA